MKVLTRESPGLLDWVQAARLKFLPQGVMPVVIAGGLAYSQGFFKPVFFAVAFLAAAAVQIGLTMFNDTLDYTYGTDRKTPGEKNPFSGGSGVLVAGVIKPRQALIFISTLYLFGLLCAIYLAIMVSPAILWIALLGAAISILYSAKPARFAYRGIGELMMFFGYGPVLTAWGYFVHTGTLTTRSLLIGAVPGILMWTMILINEIPDYEEDRAAGKYNLTYRLGRGRTKNLFIASLVALYVYIGALIVSGVLPVLASLAFLGIPLAVAAGHIASRHYLNPLKIARANWLMVAIYSVTTVAIALGLFL